LGFRGRAEEAVVADFGGAAGQDVLNKPMDELDAGKGEVASLMSAIVGIAKTNQTILDGFDPAVGDGDAEKVAGQILKDPVATTGVLGMDDPFLPPEGGGGPAEQAGLVQSRTELSAEDHRESPDGNQESRILRVHPRRGVGRQASGSHEHMDMRMEEHGARPGMQDGQGADACADITWISDQGL